MREDADHGRAGGAQPAVELEPEDGVGELRALVVAARRVRALGLQIVEVDLARAVLEARDGDDPRRASRSASASSSMPGEREVAEVVGAELQLEAVGGLAARRHHHAGVVDEQVEARVVGRRRRPRTRAPSRGRRGRARAGRARPSGPRRGSASRAIRPCVWSRAVSTTRAPGAGQLARRDQSEAAVRAGHDGRSPRLIRDLRCRPLAHPRRIIPHPSRSERSPTRVEDPHRNLSCRPARPCRRCRLW